jgi:hypothetical protein
MDKVLAKSREGLRETVLGEEPKVGEVFYDCFFKYGFEELGSAAIAIGARPPAVRRYYSGRGVATRQHLAVALLEAKYDREFRTEAIPILVINETLSTLLPSLGQDKAEEETVADRTIDMTFLEPLRVGIVEDGD